MLAALNKWKWLLIGAALTLLVVVDETWLAPGPVAYSHAEFEAQCERCHPGFGGAPKENCLACKSEMRLVLDRGIHRFGPETECAACHRDHRMREYPLASAWVDPERFDHNWTGWPLDRFHQPLTCDQCHPPNVAYREAATDCQGCHPAMDEPGWSHPGWNHDLTGCRLDEIHRDLACNRCHTGGWGDDRTPGCRECHADGEYEVRQVCTIPFD